MPLQGEYEPSSSKLVRDQVTEYESSGGTTATKLRGVPMVVITSVRASSGKLRKNPVMRVEHDGVYAAVAYKGAAAHHPAWYGNFVGIRALNFRTKAPRVTTPRARSRAMCARRGGSAGGVWPDYAEYQTKTDRDKGSHATHAGHVYSRQTRAESLGRSDSTGNRMGRAQRRRKNRAPTAMRGPMRSSATWARSCAKQAFGAAATRTCRGRAGEGPGRGGVALPAERLRRMRPAQATSVLGTGIG
jgi:deazaflavin-dependent oxidoreductase (nitroreductase family)